MIEREFRNLYCRDFEDLIYNTYLLKNMEDELRDRGYEDVACETRKLKDFVEEATKKSENYMNLLSEVFRAVERFSTGDCGEDSIKRAVENFRKAK